MISRNKTLIIFLHSLLFLIPACDTFTKARTSVELQPTTTFELDCLQSGLANHEIKQSYSQSYVQNPQFNYHQDYGLREVIVYDMAFPKYPRSQSFEVAIETCDNNKKFLSAQYSARNGLSKSKAEKLVRQTLENILNSCEQKTFIEKIENSAGFCNRKKATEKKED